MEPRIIRQRLAHPHENIVGQGLAGIEFATRRHHLVKYFTRAKVAVETHARGRTKTASHRTSGLARNAECGTSFGRDDYALDLLGITKANEELAGPVARTSDV